MNDARYKQLQQSINSILEIPANEQCIGHFQVAVVGRLNDLLDEVKKLAAESEHP